ncbi:MAG TPA: Ku protein [Thermoanaerobaculia bacterium]|jgi:DNA end-binding protein Ku|nr:Ku protein [Thermoanaerobaculia bacterium]
MAARAMWKAELAIGKEKIPVKLYAGVQDRNIHFHLLHDKDEARVEQRLVDPDTDEPVANEELRKAYETQPGTFVVLEPEELAQLEPEPSRAVEVTRFVPTGAIHHQWYERPYWLGPDGDTDTYFALVEALRSSEREGVARWVMRKRPYVGALRVEGDHLMLVALRHAGEVVLPSELKAPGGKDLDAKEKKLAEQLVDALADHFDPAAYHDTYRERVQELIDAKAKGKKPKLHRPKTKKAPESLERALQASLARTSKQAGAHKQRKAS